MFLDTRTYLPDDILVKVDRTSMGVGLEARVPLIDHRVVEFAWSLPLAYKTDGHTGKRILRSVLERHVPRNLFERPKTGFGIPLHEWLRGPLRDWGESLLAPDRLQREGVFDTATVRRCWEDHQTGRRDGHYLLWDILMFQAWLEAQAGRPAEK
jgi:asparagine synthase (glutamine-hydrolysing)